MKKSGTLLILILFLISCSYEITAESPEKSYDKISIEEIDRDIREIATQNLTNAQKMEYYSERFLGAPYLLQCEGEGEHGRYEKEPLLNLKQINCMTYCEIVLALSLSDYYEEFFNVLQHIRYRQGIISMATRNHYTMADWLPANSWCLDDISRLIGGGDTTQLTRTIQHQSFFDGKGIQDIPILLPDRDVTIDYIPLNKLRNAETQLHSGDIVALIQNRPGIFSAHMLLIVKKNDQTFFRHASMRDKKVLDVQFEEYIAELSKNPRYLGMSFMRVKEKIQWQDGVYTHGKFILP
ncbi:DUF1460 domain-containing protein [candidate division KSB1 bacterium]|nr:DUF1460 domain-containing protein [candidate division KSB1 bacterium]